MTEPVFVFGSNLAGRHGLGAALVAKQKHGAKPGPQGAIGHHGNSYAIPTKNEHLVVLPLTTIWLYVSQFIYYAKTHPELTFKLTAIGTGYAGYSADQIAPMFQEAPDNVLLPEAFSRIIRPQGNL